MTLTKVKKTRKIKEHGIFKTLGFYNLKELEDFKKDVQENHKENCLFNDEEFEELSDNEVFEKMHDDISMFYDDEKELLNKTLDNNIICIGSLGLWNGRKSGYKILGNNLNEVLTSFDCDDVKIFADRFNIKSIASHHDGTNYYTFRLIKSMDNIDNLCNKIYVGDNISNSMLNYYTSPLGHEIQKIYGY